jgi:hypothetical protein
MSSIALRRHGVKSLTALVVFTFVSAAIAPSVSGQSFVKLNASQIFSNASPSVVVIFAGTQDGEKQVLGSGFIVEENRIVTNHHVIEGMTQAYALFSDGKVQPVSEVISDSAELDLIILSVITGQRRVLSLGDELSLREGDAVYALGAPKGLELSFTNGIVSSFRNTSTQFLIQTTAPIAPGSSGGPLLDSFGHAVGVTTSRITDAPGIYFSVGIGDVRRLLRTPNGVALGLKEWADQQNSDRGKQVAADSTPIHDQNGKDKGPPLEVTLSWISDFSVQHGRHRGMTGAEYFDYIEQARGCDVKVHHSVKTGSSSSTFIDVFNLRDIDSKTVQYSRDSVIFFTLQQFRSIHRSDSASFSSHDLESDYLSFDSKENADRFVVALKHAVNLCGTVNNLF